MNYLRLTIFSILLLYPNISAFAEDSTQHVLKGRIIRALSIDATNPNHILVGQKGKSAGSALVHQSKDGGKSWRTVNGAKSVSPKASDVQSVISLPYDTIVAGTWKHGLYKSTDDGKTFKPMSGIPSKDIRDLYAVYPLLVAATGNNGLMFSNDIATNWQPMSDNKDFFWSVHDAGDILYASSPAKGVFKIDGERKWSQVFDKEGAFATSCKPNEQSNCVIAGNSGLFAKQNDGWNKLIENERFADVLHLEGGKVLAASWTNGISIIDEAGNVAAKRVLEGKPVVHIAIANEKLYAGTWGNGLYIIPLKKVLD